MKLRNKLILSCAALAAVATTAFSTTFAWYTANDSVKAQGITGATNQNDTTLLLISKTGKVGSWGAAVELDTSGVTLEPVTTTGDGVYHAWDSEANAPLEAAAVGGGDLAQSGDYISFYLYFKSGSATSLDVTIDSFTLTNTTASLPHFSVLADGTGSTETYYTVDLFKALNIVTYTANGTEVARTAASPTVNTATAERVAYECDSLAGTDTLGSTANAHTYYNNVKSLGTGEAIDDSIESSESDLEDVADLNTGSFVFSLPTGAGAQSAAATPAADNILMVRFDIYLDGWDKYCFDACRKQSFSLAMEFSGTAHV